MWGVAKRRGRFCVWRHPGRQTAPTVSKLYWALSNMMGAHYAVDEDITVDNDEGR